MENIEKIREFLASSEGTTFNGQLQLVLLKAIAETNDRIDKLEKIRPEKESIDL